MQIAKREEKPLMNLYELARYLNISRVTAYRLTWQGKIPAFKVASEWRYKKELVDEWLERNGNGNGNGNGRGGKEKNKMIQ